MKYLVNSIYLSKRLIMAPSIPDRWIPYKACGNVIDGTRLVCFKVPLNRSVQVRKTEITEIWDISTLLSQLPNMRAVVDLTNTTRYYNPKELTAAGVLHKKILMPGRILPPEKKVKEFMNTVDEFLRKDCESLIGVHCTHGLNRTGYMVCRYMRDRLGIPAKDAIEKFENARGYQIERENYIAALLGNKPPRPDVHKYTNIKPVRNRNDFKRSSQITDYRSHQNYSSNHNYSSNQNYSDNQNYSSRHGLIHDVWNSQRNYNRNNKQEYVDRNYTVSNWRQRNHCNGDNSSPYSSQQNRRPYYRSTRGASKLD